MGAWFSGVMTQLETTPKKASGRRHNDSEERGTELAMEYLSYDRTQILLDPGPYRLGKEQAHDGILQKFVEPREARDFQIRAIWSPRAAVYEKRTNK